jgi:signal transduction histidine kinase
MVIARRVVDAHGGSIEVGDAGPPGAEILVTLPRGQ